VARLSSVSIDIDSIDCYYRIHGLGEAPPELRTVIAERCLPRFAELFAELEIDATFFVVAEDVDTDADPSAHASRVLVAELASAGHEIGSHSYSHPYELARLGDERADSEIGRAHQVLADVTGESPRGFRAPGYDLSPAMQRALLARGYRYDSSIFPSPPYYLAKAAVMTMMAILGKQSGAVMTNPKALTAPAEPYRPAVGAPWRRGDAPMLELPIAVTPWARIPAIGTSLLLAPRWLRSRWLRQMRTRRHFNFELHAIDLADAEIDGIPGALVARQPDLRVPLARKRVALAETLRAIRDEFEMCTLRDAAAELAAAV